MAAATWTTAKKLRVGLAVVALLLIAADLATGSSRWFRVTAYLTLFASAVIQIRLASSTGSSEPEPEGP